MGNQIHETVQQVLEPPDVSRDGRVKKGGGVSTKTASRHQRTVTAAVTDF